MHAPSAYLREFGVCLKRRGSRPLPPHLQGSAMFELDPAFHATSEALPSLPLCAARLQLDEAGMLDQRTVLVLCLALNSEGVGLLNRRDASLVWCPSSNRFLFGRTREREEVISVCHLLLGSDSPLTAAGNLLDEVRIAHDEVGIPSGQIYRMLFQHAPSTFRLRDGEGTIRPDATADLIAVRDRGLSPAETLANLTANDIELVVVRGRVQVASEAIMSTLSPDDSSGLQPLQIGSDLRWIRAPLGRLFHEAERVLGCELKIGGKRVRHVCTAWL